jgi:malonyl CoA-acyl carrier protein transacylase
MIVFLELAGLAPRDLAAATRGATGHSQGIATAATLAMSATTADLVARAGEMVLVLFWLGLRVQEATDALIAESARINLPPAQPRKAAKGQPQATPEADAPATPMLAINGIPFALVERVVALANKNFSPGQHLSLALVNGPRSCVVAGAPRLLAELRSQLGQQRIAPGQSQTGTPFRTRLFDFRSRFLNVTSVFHSTVHAAIPGAVLEDCARRSIALPAVLTLAFPVHSTLDGAPLTDTTSEGLIHTLATLIAVRRVNWIEALRPAKSTPFTLDFGPGTSSAGLSARILEGAGSRVVVATFGSLSYEAQGADTPRLATLPDFFSRDPKHPTFSPALNWVRSYVAPTHLTFVHALTNTESPQTPLTQNRPLTHNIKHTLLTHTLSNTHMCACTHA